MHLSFRRLIYTYVGLVACGLTALGFTLYRLEQQWTAEAEQEVLIRQRALDEKAHRVEETLRQVHQNLRLVSLLPALRAYGGKNQPKETDAKYDDRTFAPELRATVQQIYNNLAGNVAVSEIYGVLADFHPENGEKPFFMLDELILQEPAKNAPEAAPGAVADGQKAEPAGADQPAEVEDEEYGWFVQAMDAAAKAHPAFDFQKLEDVPLLVSPPMRTCDNSQYVSKSKGDVRDASGLSLAVPFYGPDGQFKGLVVAILRLNVFEATLTDRPFVVVTPADRERAAAMGLAIDAPGRPYVLEAKALGIALADRRQGDVAARLAAHPEGFLVHPVEVPGGLAPWRLALENPSAMHRGGLVELIFLVFMATLVVGLSFLGMVLLAKQLRGVRTGLAAISDEVGQAAQNLRSGAESLAEKTVTASAALEQMTASMHAFEEGNASTLESGRSVGRYAAETRRNAARGTADVAAAIDSVQKVKSISTSVDLALATLKDLAFQTNLLALNASVEAARAGEAGLGFAVVADAVRVLAQKSDAAAQGIETQMAAAREHIDGAVVTVETCRAALAAISVAAERSDEAAGSVVQSLEGNVRSFQDLLGGVSQLEEINAHNASAAEEVAAVADETEDRTEQLLERVDEIGRLVD